MAKGKSRKKTTSPDAEHVTGLSSSQARIDVAKGIQGREDCEAQLHPLQVESVRPQQRSIGCDDRILVLLEGRDAAGKDGNIKRIIEFPSPREMRVVALGKPSDRERTGWYFQCYVPHFPLAEEFVLFNHSQYNWAGVESMMGSRTAEQYDEFMYSIPHFEKMLINPGTKLLEYYLGISKAEQACRLAERRRGPLEQWKTSPVGAAALKHWDTCTTVRNAMLMHTHTAVAPRYIVLADDKRTVRSNLIRHILLWLRYAGKKNKLITSNSEVMFESSEGCLDTKHLVSWCYPADTIDKEETLGGRLYER